MRTPTHRTPRAPSARGRPGATQSPPDPYHPSGTPSPRTRAFWTTADDAYELTESERELLLEVCRLVDECEELRQAVAADGMTVSGSTGRPRVPPAVGELRQDRPALGRLLSLLSLLALPDEHEGALPTPLQARGRAAAGKRWAGHVKRGA